MARQSETRSISPRAARRVVGVVVVVAAIVVIVGVSSRRKADAGLDAWTEAQAIPVVAVTPPDLKPQAPTLTLPGRLEAFQQAQLYARVSGYVKTWGVDIGARVKAGDVLAEIDAPDLDQQITQAEADLKNADASVALAKVTLERGQALVGSGAISKMTLDQRSTDYGSKLAQQNSSRANLDRLRVLSKYKQIVAPFDGIVTSRATDVGSLINAGAGGGALFVISDTSKLRVFVDVPQNEAPLVQIGAKAHVRPSEYPGRSFPATVEASSHAVDSASGTTRFQLVVDNSNGDLMTGAYATVDLDLAHSDAAIAVPASALIFDHNGLRVATVGADDRIVMKTIAISRDLGKEVEVASGIAATDRIIVSPPDGLVDGDRVRIFSGDGSRLAANGAASQKAPN